MRKREIKALVQSTADPAFAVDGMRNIAFWNKAAEEFFGLRFSEAVGVPCNTIVEGYDECGLFCTQDCSILEASLRHTPMQNFDLRLMTKGGRKWCNVSILVTDENRSVSPFTIHIIRPIDATKRLERVLRDFVVSETELPPEQAVNLITNSRSPARETPLTAREQEVLGLLAKGQTTAKIAAGLFISPTTVNNHIQHIMKKMNAHSRLEAIRRAELSGLV